MLKNAAGHFTAPSPWHIPINVRPSENTRKCPPQNGHKYLVLTVFPFIPYLPAFYLLHLL